MSLSLGIAAIWLAIALAHSVLGERLIIGPLVAGDLKLRVPSRFGKRLLRFAWHATSAAWLGLAGIQLGWSTSAVIGAVGLVSAGAMLVFLREHFAWPLFLGAGLLGLHADSVIGGATLQVLALAAAAVLLVLGGLHFVWAAGRPPAAVIPTKDDGQPLFSPPAWLTVAVGFALLTFSGLVAAVSLGVGPTQLRWLVWLGAGALLLRAIGDFRFAGFSKRVHGTAFGRADDLYYTPLVTLLCFGVVCALAS